MKRQAPCEFCLMKKAVRTRKTQKMELTTLDGKIYELTSTPFNDTDGKTKVIEIVRDITELKEREKEYKNLIDSMNDTAFVIDFEGNFVEVNKTAVDVLGYSREELLSMGPNDIDANLSQEDIERLIDRMKMGETGAFETAHKTKSGEIISVEVSSSLVPYKGKPYILSIARNITERKEIADALRESEEQLSVIFNSSSDLQILFSPDEDGEFRIVRVNKTAIETPRRLGFDASEETFLGKTVKEIVKSFLKPNQRSPEDTLKTFQEAAETGKPVFFDESYAFGNKHYYSEVTIVPILDRSRKCIYLLWTSHNITERKKALESLKESEERFQRVIDDLPLGILLHNLDGSIVMVNKASCELGGYTKEELLNLTVADLDPQSISREDRKNYWLSLKKGVPRRLESVVNRKDGSTFPAEIYICSINLKGRPMILAAVYDITERIATLEKLKESEEQLSVIFNNASDMLTLWSVDKDGEFRLTRVNQTSIDAAGAFGIKFSRENHIGQTLMETAFPFTGISKEFYNIASKHFRQTVKTCKPAFFEQEISFLDRIFYAENTTVPVLDERGKCVYILWTIHNITKQKQTLKALQESEDQLSVIFNNASDPLLLLSVDKDRTFPIAMANRSVTVVARNFKSDLPQESFIGKTLQEAVLNAVGLPDEVFNNAFKCIKETVKTGKPGFYEENYNFGNENFYTEVTTVPVLNQEGNCVYILLTLHDITKTKKTLEALRESEERFETVIENLPDEIFVHGLDGKFILVNKASCEKTGYTKEELLNMKVGEIDHESVSRDDRKNIWLKLQKKGGFERIESTHYRKDGSSYPAEIYFGTVTFKGTPMIIGIAHEITERKKAIEKLKESEERFETVIENLPHGVSVHNLNGNFILVNEAFCKQTGYTRDEYMKMKVADIDPHSQTRDDRKSIWLRLKKGGHTHFESEHFRKDGSRYPAEIYLSAITLEGEPMILGISQDISDTKKVLESLQKSEEKYRNLYDSMTDAFARIDIEGNIIECNKQYLDMLGYTEEEIKNLNYTDLTPENWYEMEMKIKEEQIIKRGYSDVYEKEYIKKDGTVFPVELRAFLLRDDDGNPRGIWAIVRDITERKKIEEELRKIERLESLGILAGGIAHDFNNLLTGILGNLSIIQMAEGEDLQNILEEAKQASIQAKNLTQQLLTFSKGGEPIKGKVAIENIIRESAEFSLHGSNVSCQYDFPNNLWKVEVDKGQISQVIDNLVINSDQAMPEGGKIHIKAENVILDKENLLNLSEGKYIKITLQDEGIGMPEEFLPKIFDPYFSTKQEGSGLGLATVFSIIQRHDGHIAVESEVGKGTTFYIYLPAIEEKPSEKRDEKESKKTLTGEGKILIMDDERIVRRAVGGMLGKLGYTVELAVNGEEALVKYKEAKNAGKPFDAVILDLTVPGGMGGKKTIEALLKIDPDVKAIVSSGYSTDPVMANYEKYGFKAVAAKPFDLGELSKAIEKALG